MYNEFVFETIDFNRWLCRILLNYDISWFLLLGIVDWEEMNNDDSLLEIQKTKDSMNFMKND